MSKKCCKIALLFPLLAVFFFACEKEVTSSVDTEKPAVNRMLFVDSNPQGSMIYVNDRISGKTTPDTLFWLEDTTYKITLKRDLFRDTSFFVHPDLEIVKKAVNYYTNPKMYGNINCESKPIGADIYINDSLTGLKTPTKVGPNFPGKYKVTYKYPECRDANFYLNVKSDASVGYRVALEDTSVWVSFTSDNSELPDNLIRCVTVDHDNVLWVGTEYGLLSFDGANWNKYTPDNSGLSTDFILSLAVDHNNVLWIGTTYGAVRYDRTTWTVYDSFNSLLPNDVINIIEIDNHNNIWFGTSYGIGVLEGNEWTLYNTDNCDIAGNIINSICTNVYGEIWAASARTGISRYFGVWKPIPKIVWGISAGIGGSPPTPGQNISSIKFSPDNYTWLGFIPKDARELGGLVGYDGRNFKQYKNMVSNYITCIYIDDDNVKWVGTDAGLVRFKDYSERKIFIKNYTGMKSNMIVDLVKDKNDVVWIATDYGLLKYKGEAQGN